jgi:hypothetical protein
MKYLALAAFALATTSAPARAEEICASGSGGQYARGIQHCVSSVLARHGETTYGPEHLSTGETGAWCEGVAGPGIGETITIRIEDGVAFRRLVINNGYGKSAQTYARNGRIKTVEITSDTGIKARLALPDRRDTVRLMLPKPAKRWVRLKIVEVYPGERHADTCLTYVSPDFEYEDTRPQKR